MLPTDPSLSNGLLPRFGRDMLRYLPAKIIPGLATLVSIPIFTHLLTRAEFGRVALVETTVTLGAVTLTWTRVSLVRLYPAGDRDEAQTLVRTAMLVQIASVATLALTALAVLVWSGRLGAGSGSLVFLGVVLFAARAPYRFFLQLLRARLEPGAFSKYQSWAAVIALVAGATLAGVFRLGDEGVVLGAAIGAAAVVPALWRRALRGIRALGPVSRSALTRMAGYGLPLALGLLGAWSLRRLDRYQIELFYDSSAVGVYSAAYGIGLNSILLMGAAFKLSSHPLLATTFEREGDAASREFLTHVTRLYLLMALPAAAGLALVAEPTMRFLTRPEYAEAWTILPWVAGGSLFLGLQEFFSQALTLVHRTRLVMVSMLAAAAANGLLNWWALPRFGPVAAAVTTFASYLLLCLLVAGAAWRHFRWRFPVGSTARSLAAVALMGAVVLGILQLTSGVAAGLRLLAAVPAGMLVYGVALIALRECTWTELRSLARLDRGAG